MPSEAVYTQVATASTNTATGSNVDVRIAGATAAWTIIPNANHDTLPVIPADARVEHGKILYQLKIKVSIHTVGGGPVVGKAITIASSRPSDQIVQPNATGTDGACTLVLRSRDAGPLQLSLTAEDVTSSPFAFTLKDAWYESPFLQTGYHVCNEDDFNGALANASGLNEQHKDDFLYGARGVIMQGTGMGSNGRYIRVGRMGSTWLNNSHGHPTHVADPAAVTFAYATNAIGAFAAVTPNHSLAVDTLIIPARATVQIEDIGVRSADDRGSRIVGYHIDNFVGAGAAVQEAWEHGPYNNAHKKVKYIGN